MIDIKRGKTVQTRFLLLIIHSISNFEAQKAVAFSFFFHNVSRIAEKFRIN